MFSCDEDGKNETGSLTVRMSTWKSYENNSKSNLLKSVTKSNTHTLDIIDVRGYKYAIKVTTDDINEGVPDNFNWTLPDGVTTMTDFIVEYE